MLETGTLEACTSALCVLASGSRGNCSLLRVRTSSNAAPKHLLIDLGLSPRRTTRLLAEHGLTLDRIDAVLMTHLDQDHCHPGWSATTMADATLPRRTEVLISRGHRGRAARLSFNGGRYWPFATPFSISGVNVNPLLNPHDELGTACFRITFDGGSLGFATDLGRISDTLVAHLRGVDVLAIESNYCEQMQLSSDRPAFLKQRIMGGKGHLSNGESAEAVRRIAPAEHVVLLHLSEQCNRPELALGVHALTHSAGRMTVTSHDQPTAWIPIGAPASTVTQLVRMAPALRSCEQPLLFG